MLQEDEQTIIQRFYELLHFQLAAEMPRKGGIHIYAEGTMFDNFTTHFTSEGVDMVMSEGVPYSRYVMGYDDNMNKRTPRTGKYSKGLEAINFRTIERNIVTIAKCLAEVGGVTLDGNKI